jgi:hypothetical protein
MRDQIDKDLESSNQDKLKALDEASLGAFQCIREDLKSGFKMAEERLDAMLERDEIIIYAATLMQYHQYHQPHRGYKIVECSMAHCAIPHCFLCFRLVCLHRW